MSCVVNYPRGSGKTVSALLPASTSLTSATSPIARAEDAPAVASPANPLQEDRDQTRIRRRQERIEDREQAAYIAEVDAAIQQGRDGADCIFAVPNANAGSVRIGQVLKETGRRAGVPDLQIAVPRELAGVQYAGCFLEMKRPAGNLSDVSTEQREWLDRLAARGYLAVVVFGWREALALTRRYLGWGEE